MDARKRTPADAGTLAAGLLVDACQADREGPLHLEVVRGLAVDLGCRLEALSETDVADSPIESALACADLATLAVCNLQALPGRGRPLAEAAVYLAAGTTLALLPLIEAEAAAEDAETENTLRDARSARWRAELAVRQLEGPREDGRDG